MNSNHWFCNDCRHLNAEEHNCTAFPDGLPFMIVSGQIQHDHQIEGDNGVKYQKKEANAYLANLTACVHCASTNTSRVGCGITGRSIQYAAESNGKYRLFPNRPDLRKFICNACNKFFD